MSFKNGRLLAGLLLPAALRAAPQPPATQLAPAAPAPQAAAPAVPLSTAPVSAAAAPSTAAPRPSAALTVLHPTEGQRFGPQSQIFVFGAVTPGSTVTINNSQITVHPSGGYLSMAPVVPGDQKISVDAKALTGENLHVEKSISVSPGFVPMPEKPLAIARGSVAPWDDQWLAAGDQVTVSFQGSPGAAAEFGIDGLTHRRPMVELVSSTGSHRGIYQGVYVLQPGEKAERAAIEVQLKRDKTIVKERAPGRLSIDMSGTPRLGLVTEDTVAARTGPEGGYDLFLYKGMRVRLAGKIGGQWRVRFSSIQTGWVKDGAIQELPPGTLPAQAALTNFTMAHQDESTLIRVPLAEVLPYRVEQSLDPMQLTITLYGAVDKTDLIRYDPADQLIRQVRWRQLAPDTAQIVIEPKFAKWWGFDVRYEGTTLVAEIRKPWTPDDLKGMVIAIDPGHGGADTGATGPHGLYEKDGNLEIAQMVRDLLERAGAKPFLTREKDIDVSLYDRPRIAWNRNARLFISIHCNAAGETENPVWNNGYSTYWYQPQSRDLADRIHSGYLKHLTIPDHGLYFADFAVCRMTQMPAVLTEQAFIIVPEQEQLIFDPRFQRQVAVSILSGIRAFIAKP